MDNLETSLQDYNEQLSMVNKTLVATKDEGERESLLALQSDLQQLIQLTQESLDAVAAKETLPETTTDQAQSKAKDDLDEEYALFMQEMAQSDASNSNKDVKPECSQNSNKTQECSDNSDIEDELAALLGMKCAVYHTHKWGGQPSLHNAMVSAVVPRQHNDQFTDLQVQVLFTHPTHAEMLPCPFYLDGECKFSDEQCRFSHGDVVNLSSLKEAIEPNFDSIKIGSLILLKLKPPDKEDITLRKKCSEIYHLWHRAIVENVDFEKRYCIAKLEHGVKTGEKRKAVPEKFHVRFEDIFPLGNENDEDSSSEESLSDTEYRESKSACPSDVQRELLVEKSLQNNAPVMGEWERHTRGIGSKLMLSMGYVPGTGLGAAGEGRLAPVEAKVVPLGRSLDHCLMLSERAEGQDPFKVEQRLKRLQKKEEERNKRAYEREKEKERRNVFNFINKTLGDQPDEPQATAERVDIRQSTSKDLNIEKFKIEEDSKKIERELVKLNSSLIKHPPGSNGHRSVNVQIAELKKELSVLKCKEKQIANEQTHRKDKQKMTVF